MDQGSTSPTVLYGKNLCSLLKSMTMSFTASTSNPFRIIGKVQGFWHSLNRIHVYLLLMLSSLSHEFHSEFQ